MIDPDITAEALLCVSIGDVITGTLHDGTRFSGKCNAIMPYALSVKTETGGMSVPISLTDVYKEIEMARVPMPTGQLAAKPTRGRPRKDATAGGNAAPVEQPGMALQPPQPRPQALYTGPLPVAPPPVMPSGIDYSKLIPPAPQQQEAWAVVSGQPLPGENGIAPYAEVQTHAGQAPKEMTIHQAEGDPDWKRAAVEDAINELRQNMMALIDSIEEDGDAQEPEPAMPEIKYTCVDCMHFDEAANMCGMFRTVPPFAVIVEPVGKCTSFDVIPF